MEEVQVTKGGRRIIEVWEPNYRMKPDENEYFRPSEVKAIATRVIHSKLDGKTYSEEDSKRWAVEIADEIRLGAKELRIPRYKVCQGVCKMYYCCSGKQHQIPVSFQVPSLQLPVTAKMFTEICRVGRRCFHKRAIQGPIFMPSRCCSNQYFYVCTGDSASECW